MATVISNFHGDNFFLSNFYQCQVVLDGEIYPTVEHAFQAAKTLDQEQRQNILQATTMQAKQLGRSVTMRQDWEKIKFDIMFELLQQKFSQAVLRQSLLDTGDSELIEGNTWGDKLWGCVLIDDQWIGQNHLGKLLMKVRADIQNESIKSS